MKNEQRPERAKIQNPRQRLGKQCITIVAALKAQSIFNPETLGKH